MAAASKVLTQEAVTEALGSDVPPRDAAERVTFATWAIVTGKSPGGIFNDLPEVDDATAAKIAERLTERVDEGTVTADDVRGATTVEALASTVRDYLEGGKVDGFVRTLRAPQEGPGRDPGVRVPRRRRVDCGVRAAAQAVAREHPDVRHRARRGLDRGAGQRVRAQVDGNQRRPSVHPGRLVAGRRARLRLRDRTQEGGRRRALRRPHRRGAAGRADPADQGGDSRPLGPLRPVRRAHLQRRGARRSPTRNSRSSTTRVR